MIWALVTRLSDVLAVIGLGTVLYFVIRLTRLISAWRAR